MCILVSFYVASTPAAHVRGPRPSLRASRIENLRPALSRASEASTWTIVRRRGACTRTPLLETAWTLLSRVWCKIQGR